MGPAAPAATAAETALRAEIAARGPVTVAAFMARALHDPVHGYYRTRDPLGAEGDFVTAPEISQMFGELIGLWCAELWLRMGSPAALRLVELGPGRGSLLRDALRAIGRAAPACAAALDLHLVEINPALRALQRRALGERPARWHDDPATLPDGPSLVIANELLDALPIHQLERTAAGWCERVVTLDADGRLTLEPAAAPSPLAARLAPPLAEAPIGSIAELCPDAVALVEALARRLATQGGAALLIDYGYAAPAPGDSLQALRRHRMVPVLEAIGEADLTAHVDFAALATAAAPHVAVHGPVPQGLFLRRLGIEARAATLMTGKPADVAAGVRTALARLIEPSQMGLLFKALALAPAALGTPPGFDP